MVLMYRRLCSVYYWNMLPEHRMFFLRGLMVLSGCTTCSSTIHGNRNISCIADITTFHLSNVNVTLCASAHNCFAACDSSVDWHRDHVCLFIHMILFGIDRAVCSLLLLPSFCPPTLLLSSASSHNHKEGWEGHILFYFSLLLSVD